MRGFGLFAAGLLLGSAIQLAGAQPKRDLLALNHVAISVPNLDEGSLAVWVLMTMGLAGWGWQESLSFRMIAMDSTVNLVGVVAASLAGGLSQRARSHQRSTAQMRLDG